MERRIRACRDWQQQRVDLVVRSKTLLSPDSVWKFGAETDCEQCGPYLLTFLVHGGLLRQAGIL